MRMPARPAVVPAAVLRNCRRFTAASAIRLGWFDFINSLLL
jgi:hypothetical protein